MSKYEDLQADFVAQGFERLDAQIISKRPPKIQWGQQYRDFPIARKIEYLEKLAATMNHAASLIQDERDQLTKLCELKEEQINSMKQAIEQNMNMLQSEITRINEERQLFNSEAVKLKNRIRELEGNGSLH